MGRWIDCSAVCALLCATSDPEWQDHSGRPDGVFENARETHGPLKKIWGLNNDSPKTTQPAGSSPIDEERRGAPENTQGRTTGLETGYQATGGRGARARLTEPIIIDMETIEQPIYSIQRLPRWIKRRDFDLAEASGRPESPYFCLFVDYQEQVKDL